MPTQWSFWPSGEPGPDIERGDNPVVTSTFEGGYNDNKQYKNEMTFRLGIDPPMIKGLTINGFFSYDLYNRYQKIFRKRSEEHTSELQSLMRISYAVFCLKKKTKSTKNLRYNSSSH